MPRTLPIVFLLIAAGSSELRADCTAEVDCYTLCNTAFYLSCKCYTGQKKCKECTCHSPGCSEMGSCCCTRQDGSQNCTQLDSCGSGWGGALPAEAQTGAAGSAVAVNRPGMPELNRLSFTWSETGVGSGSYAIRNTSDSGVVAMEILWYLETSAGVLRLATWVDNWIAETAFLPATLEMEDAFDAYVGVKSGAVRRIVAMVSYAEFQHGKKLGDPERASLIYQRRQQIRDAYMRLRTAFASGGAEGFAAALRTEPRQTPAEQAAKTRLGQILRDEGIEAALADISRVLSRPAK